MPHKITFVVAAKNYNLPDCVKLVQDKNYDDTVVRGNLYKGETQVTVSFINYCNKPFTVDSFVLFSNEDNNGTFQAKVDGFTIGSNQTINIPLRYYGIINSDDSLKNYLVPYNGSSLGFTLHITQPKPQHPPVMQSVEILLDNRQNYTFKLSDFTDKYSDPDGDAIDSVILEGDLSAFRLNGQPLISPATITTYFINIGALSYIARDTDDEVNVMASLKAKDATGLTSS